MGTEQIPPTAPSSRHPAPQRAVDPRPDRRLLDRMRGLAALLTERPVSLYAVSVLRIGYGLLYLGFLLREFPHRDQIWGPGAPWTPAMSRQLFDQTGWASVLTLSDSRPHFELCYAGALVTAALFMLGWRTRAVSILFAVMVTSFHSRAIFMTDGGDNLILLMAVYLVFTACGRRWSLDARRARRRRARADTAPKPRRDSLWRQLHDARKTFTTVLHNCGIVTIAAQVCFLYGSSGLYKVQGGTWGNGTALHYVLNLELFQPWPTLSHLADDHVILVAIASYLTVFLQVAFPFVLFSRLKYPVLTLLLGMHVGIAVLLGLPLFSGAMIIADAVFFPDRFYTALRPLCRRAVQLIGIRRTHPQRRAGSVSVPPQGRSLTPSPHRRPVPATPKGTTPTAEITSD